jgi:hypothetical protein
LPRICRPSVERNAWTALRFGSRSPWAAAPWP